ncbi:MAG: cobalt-precorrin-5B (C(1))-methyltransferase [Dehalococcoidales bacterium]|nr:cobalt-precorrin-5B (C(1))-methyltransferase [Dehalococcoidales bacterium]
MMLGAGMRGLRYGYTTGACAAAAAKAATLALLAQKTVGEIEVDLPGGGKAGFVVKSCVFDRWSAVCSVIKDAGDDPDVTDGAEVIAEVKRGDAVGIIITGGEGVGTVTKPGLEVPVGMPAINPVPRRMIEQAVVQAARACGAEPVGFEVVVSVKDGEVLAKRTLNRRLGIVGGISILGTTGIVVPYSPDAYMACIAQAIDVAAACGGRHVVLTTGRRSEQFAQAHLRLPEECFIQAGDFIGYALRQCVEKGICTVTVWGMAGKLGKIAAGHLYTNVSDSRVDMGFLVGVAERCGLTGAGRDALRGVVTANQLQRMLPEHVRRRFCDEICRLAAESCRREVGGGLSVHCIMSDYQGVILGEFHG